MSFGRTLGFGIRSRRNVSADLQNNLPEVNSFVEISIDGSAKRESVAIDEIRATQIVTRLAGKMLAGADADFLYITSEGRFRFTTVCREIDRNQAFFDLPSEIKTIESFAHRRADVRVPWIIPIEWRYVRGGHGDGPFQRGSMKDLSRSGTSLVVNAELPVGSQVEARFTLKTKTDPVVQVCEVVRASKIQMSDKNMFGIRFVDIDAAEAEKLDTFVHERKTQRRNRGIV
jgi:hypothetical protein